jgi:hypothetical protein
VAVQDESHIWVYCGIWMNTATKSRLYPAQVPGEWWGAVYAAGYHPNEIIERFLEIDQSHLFGRQA